MADNSGGYHAIKQAVQAEDQTRADAKSAGPLSTIYQKDGIVFTTYMARQETNFHICFLYMDLKRYFSDTEKI